MKDHNKALKARGISLQVRDPKYVQLTRAARAAVLPEAWAVYEEKARQLKDQAVAPTQDNIGVNVVIGNSSGSASSVRDLSLLSASHASRGECGDILNTAMVSYWPLDVDRLRTFKQNQSVREITGAFRQRHCHLGVQSSRKVAAWPREVLMAAIADNESVAKLRVPTFEAVFGLFYFGDRALNTP